MEDRRSFRTLIIGGVLDAKKPRPLGEQLVELMGVFFKLFSEPDGRVLLIDLFSLAHLESHQRDEAVGDGVVIDGPEPMRRDLAEDGWELHSDPRDKGFPFRKGRMSVPRPSFRSVSGSHQRSGVLQAGDEPLFSGFDRVCREVLVNSEKMHLPFL